MGDSLTIEREINMHGFAKIGLLFSETTCLIDLSYNDVKCGKIHVTLNMIGSTFFQSQSNFV